LNSRSSLLLALLSFFFVLGVSGGLVMSITKSDEEAGLISGGGSGNKTTGSICTSALNVSILVCTSLFSLWTKRGSDLICSTLMSFHDLVALERFSFRGSDPIPSIFISLHELMTQENP